MSKKLTSTLLLFAVFIGFLWWGLQSLVMNLTATQKNGEEIVYSCMILICSIIAGIAILMLPKKNQS